MSKAYSLLGILILLVLFGAYFAFNRAEAPSPELAEEEESGEEASPSSPMSLTLSSPSFPNNGDIPEKYTCDGENLNPELRVEGVPEGTESLVLVMDDPDIPQVFKDQRGIEAFDHWAVYNISPDTTVIEEGSAVGTEGKNGRGETAYAGPCPPTEYEPTEHRYSFRLYALSGTLNFVQTPTLKDIEDAAKGMELDSTTLIGKYDRAK